MICGALCRCLTEREGTDRLWSVSFSERTLARNWLGSALVRHRFHFMFVVQELKLLMAHASDIQIIEMNVSLGWIGVVRLLHPFCRVAESERDTTKDALSSVCKGNFSSKTKRHWRYLCTKLCNKRSLLELGCKNQNMLRLPFWFFFQICLSEFSNLDSESLITGF